MTEMSGHSLSSKQEEPKPISSLNDDLRSSLATKDCLGAVLTKQGRYEEAETLLKEVLDTRERLGESRTSSDMLRTMNNLGAAYGHQGRFIEAETLHRQVLESDKQSLGYKHASTITAMHNLASSLLDQNKLDEAHNLQQHALQLSQKVHGPEAPETLTTMGNLGNILLHQHKYEQGEIVSRETLKLRQKVLRSHHPDIGNAMSNLSVAFRKQGKVDEFEELQRQIAAFHQSKMEDMTGMSDIAKSPANSGHYDKLEQSLQERLRQSVESLGINSPKARSDMGELGNVLIRNGKYKEAEEVFRNALVAGTA